MHTQGTQQGTPLRPFGKRSWLLDLHVKLHRKDSQSCARRSGAMVTICQHRHAAQKRSELQVTHQILEETCGVFCNCMPWIYREGGREREIYIYIYSVYCFIQYVFICVPSCSILMPWHGPKKGWLPGLPLQACSLGSRWLHLMAGRNRRPLDVASDPFFHT